MSGSSPNLPVFPLRKYSLRAQVTLSVVIPLLLILGSFLVIQYIQQRNNMIETLNIMAMHNGEIIENSLQEAMQTRDQQELQNILDSISQNKILRSIYLLDSSGHVVFAPKGKDVGKQLSNQDPTCLPCHALPVNDRPSSVIVALPDGQRVFRSMIPINNQPACQNCHSPLDKINGVLLTDISLAPMEAPMVRDMWEHLLWGVAALLVTVLVSNLVIDRMMLRRLAGLSSAITNLGNGQSPTLLPESRLDEIGQVTAAFNVMARQVERREVENKQLSENLQIQNSQRGELLKRVITIQEEERKRVARELHDELGQSLAGLSLHMEVLCQLIQSNPAEAVNLINQIQTMVTGTFKDMHDLVMAMRPPLLDNLGLVSALHALAVRSFTNTGIQFEMDASRFAVRLPPDLETILFRVYQEALNNIIRHSGASVVKIVLKHEDCLFTGEVVDNGCGFNLQTIRMDGNVPQGLGLLGMQERVMQYHGRLEIHSNPGAGTRVRVEIPVEEVRCD